MISFFLYFNYIIANTNIGDYMRNIKYEKIADFYKPKEKKLRNCLISFISGGIVGMLGEIIIEIFCYKFHFSRTESSTFMIMIIIFLASLFTALGFFDNWVNMFKCGLIIPITGFAHSMTSSTIDYKKEGLIYGFGSNMFKLAGSVILYGIISAWFFGMIRYIIGGGS